MLKYLRKLLVRMLASQNHLLEHNIYPDQQSAYRKNFSTETLLLKVKNDLLMNMNKQHVTLLVLLDLSAAFDTIDHKMLIVALKLDVESQMYLYVGLNPT